MKKSVYVGMSGGVDSSVTAALLLEQGYNVTGVYMKNWTADVLGFACPWRQDLTDAQSVAAKLGIPLKIFDFQKQYRQKVVDHMVGEYKAGYTPNPDIMCNQEIKFKLFLDTALEDGADLIATGHYARLKPLAEATADSAEQVGQRHSHRAAASEPNALGLFQAKDQDKDQTYFLYRVTKESLSKTLMPLGGLTKTKVRQLAKQFGLPNAEKPDSVGICFIGEVSITDFLKQYIKPKTGPIKTLDGKVVGEHEGAVFYTIGQRHGLKVGGGRPFYVVGKDVKTNTVFVTNNPADDELYKDSFLITDTHWINQLPDSKKTYQIRTRHLGRLVDGRLTKQGQKYQIKLVEPERAITPGQSAVVYEDHVVLGGGIIAAV